MVIDRETWAALEAEEFNLQGDYSGRGMYGAHCVAVIGPVSELARFMVEVTHLVGDNANLIEELLQVRSDQFGSELVFYFPGVTRETAN